MSNTLITTHNALARKLVSDFRNPLLLKTLSGETTSRPPVWIMRQAGRYLPQYMKIREKYDFFTRIQTPELACEITIQPVDIIGVDAAIIFSDILVVPQAMGLEVQMIEGKGPVLPNPVRLVSDMDRISIPDVNDRLHYVMDAIRLTKSTLDKRVPIIGFAGAPWTVFCYMVEGKGSKSFDFAREFSYTHPEISHAILDKITETTIRYLKAQVRAGADIIQIFDSWAGLLGPDDYRKFSLPYIKRITSELKNDCPMVVFAKGAWYAIADIANTDTTAIGLDWIINPQFARKQASQKILQGNLDPAKLLMPIPDIKKAVKNMIIEFGKQRYIANLGHGIMKNVPVDHAKAFVDAVKECE